MTQLKTTRIVTRRLDRSSIRRKLTLIILATCAVSILVACVALAIYDTFAFRSAMESQLMSTAGIAGSNSTAALTFSDAGAAREVLGSLRSEPHIVQACIYDANGTALPKYARFDSDPDFAPPPVKAAGVEFTARQATLFEPIRFSGEQIGTIYLKSDLGELYARAKRFLDIVVLVMAGTFVIAYILAAWLQRLISRPVLELARTASAVSTAKDYSLRASKISEDEIGELADQFNEMLAQIQARDSELQAARQQLELRVEERTRELRNEVAERKEAERQLEERTTFLNSVIENSPVGIVAVGPDSKIQMCNPAFEKLFQVRKEGIRSLSLRQVVGNMELEQELDANKEAIWRGEATHVVSKRARTDGTLVDVEAWAVPLFIEGKMTGAVLLYQDITERKRAEKALVTAKEAAEAASRAKSEFLANMSHEIRTPMNGIIGMTELALDTHLSAEQREYLVMVRGSAESLLTLINDILDFSKIEAGKMEVDLIDFDFGRSLGETLRTLAYRAYGKGLELAWRVGPGIPERLRGDVGRLRQVIVNLLGNALKFTEHGEVVLDVEKEAEDKEGILLHFRVRDTGIGIPAEKQQMIFEAFTQGDSSSTRKYGGTGLGLAISAQLVALMGGKIWVESEVGHGSVFHFTARFHHADSEGKPMAPFDPELLRDVPVLVVDDNQTNRLILKEMLASWGMRPDVAADGKTALRSLNNACHFGSPFRLVITDMQMPEMDGLSLCEKIRQNKRFGDVAILLLSSSLRQGEAARCRELRVGSYLAKPVQPSELLDRVLTALARHPLPADQPPGAQGPVEERKQKMRILLAEDNSVNRKLAVTLLQKRGHEVMVAENGQEVLDVLELERVDLVLMDVQMPVMDGLEAIRAIRMKEQSTGAHLPIIALTAHAMKGDRERCLAAGADEYVAKPIRLAELSAAMEKVKAPAPLQPADQLIQGAVRETSPASRLDLAVALERVEGDRELLEEIARLFADESLVLLGEIRRARASEDIRELQRLAHTLKGAALNVAALKVAEIALALETQARSGSMGNADDLIEHLVREVELVLPEIDALCRKVAKSTKP